MTIRMVCYTLFNITQTGVINRSKPDQDNIQDWIRKRNTQCNFDTILQVISLRSQPDVVKAPMRLELTDDILQKFGFLYQLEEDNNNYWKFEFDIQHPSVFENGIIPLGALYKDCDGVPMIHCVDQLQTLNIMLDTSEEFRNIYFEVV